MDRNYFLKKYGNQFINELDFILTDIQTTIIKFAEFYANELKENEFADVEICWNNFLNKIECDHKRLQDYFKIDIHNYDIEELLFGAGFEKNKNIDNIFIESKYVYTKIYEECKYEVFFDDSNKTLSFYKTKSGKRNYLCSALGDRVFVLEKLEQYKLL